MQNNTRQIHTFYSNTASYNVEKRKNNRGIEFHYHTGMDMLIFIIFPLGMLSFAAYQEEIPYWVLFLSLGFILFINSFFNKLKNTILVFDTQKEAFYKLDKKTKKKSDFISFSKIEAIQLLHYEHISSDDNDTTYTDAYELNLVLASNRFNIEANSNYKAIRENARKVSNLLNVPIVEVKNNA